MILLRMSLYGTIVAVWIHLVKMTTELLLNVLIVALLAVA